MKFIYIIYTDFSLLFRFTFVQGQVLFGPNSYMSRTKYMYSFHVHLDRNDRKNLGGGGGIKMNRRNTRKNNVNTIFLQKYEVLVLWLFTLSVISWWSVLLAKKKPLTCHRYMTSLYYNYQT